MKLYVECYYAGVMPGPMAHMRDRLVPCEPRPIALDAKEGMVSSSIHSRINERAGLARDRVKHFGLSVVEKVLPNGRVARIGA